MGIKRTIIATTLLMLIIAATAAWGASVELTSARVAYKQGEYTRAIENLLKEVEKNPEVEAYYLLGKCYGDMKDFKSCGEYFVLAEKFMDTEKEVEKWAVEMDDDRRQYWYNGYQAIEPVYKEAKGYLDDPESAPPGVTAESKFEEAISGFEAMYNIYPYHPRSQYLIGTAYEMIAGDVRYKYEDGALVEYKKDDAGEDQTREVTDAEYRDLPMVKANDAYLLSLEVKLDDMAGEGLDPDFPLDYHITKVIGSSAMLDNFDDALEVISAGAEKFPDDPVVLYWEARIYETEGDFVEAARIYESVLSKEGGDTFVDAYNALGDIYLDEDFADYDPQKALEYLEKALEIAPDNYKIIFSLGKAYGEIGKNDKKKEYLILGQTLYKIDDLAKMNAPKDEAVTEFGEPEETFSLNTEYRGQEIEVEVAKFTFEDVIFYVKYYSDLSLGWSTARPTE
ncbi:MAG: tetratricopeptide repeat protein [bacterium]|nr:tetratricopeptide repeat protein [bacterium]